MNRIESEAPRGVGPSHEDADLWSVDSPRIVAPRRQERVREQRPPPQTTIEAIMYCVRTRGPKALHEPENLERLSRCDAASLAQIDARMAKLKESGR